MAQEEVTAPIPGVIVSIEVTLGTKVAEGDTICFLESMKMSNPILAPLGGTVTKISAAPGQVIKAGQLIAVIEY